jgi:t-SNARE complex subunit (syntaxin)
MTPSDQRFAYAGKTFSGRTFASKMLKERKERTEVIDKDALSKEFMKAEKINLSVLKGTLEQRKKREITYLIIMFISVCLLFLYKLLT